MQVRSVEPAVHFAALALSSSAQGGGRDAGIVVVVAAARVRSVRLRESREISDGAGEGVCSSEGYDDAFVGGNRRVVEGNVAAGVGEEGARVPRL